MYIYIIYTSMDITTLYSNGKNIVYINHAVQL